MKYIEYVYLILALMGVVFLATEMKHLKTGIVIPVLVATGLFAFMFAFRRGQRQQAEARWQEELERLEKEVEEDSEENDKDS